MATIKTGMPGIFYRRPSPDEEPFVQEGQEVEAGRTVGLVEVMKNFNEIKAEQSGTITRFLVEDGDEVSIGQDVIELGD